MNERKNFDATFCGKLPIHQVNAVQPHGVLLLVDRDLRQVLQVSENVTELLGRPAAEIVSLPFTSLVAADSLRTLEVTLREAAQDKVPLGIRFLKGNTDYNVPCLVHGLEEGYIIEATLQQYFTQPSQSFVDIYQRYKQIVQLLSRSEDVEQLCHVVAREVRKWSGFDKVMIYRFDESWNGTVLAESAEEGMELYKGFTFPASDIPKPAREMYAKNPYRLIPDREYTPVRLHPVLNPVTNGFTNLLNADLRSVAGVHVEYLKNMGVMASMSTRILYQEKLWGLIACHHRTPKFLSFEECSIIEMISQILTEKISALQLTEAAQMRKQMNLHFAQIVERISEKNNLLEAFTENAGVIKKFLQAGGVALSWNGHIETEGETPAAEEIETLIYWLRNKARDGIYHENSLSRVFDEGKQFAAAASGILALPIQPDKGHYLIAFRPEWQNTISWGGNPNDAVRFEPNSTAYHPRYSFKAWQETIFLTARQWHPEEVRTAEQFRIFLVQHTLNRLN